MKRRFYKATSVAAWLPVLMLFFASTSAYGQKKESVDVMMISGSYALEDLVKILGKPDMFFQEEGVEVFTALYPGDDFFKMVKEEDGTFTLKQYMLFSDNFSVNGICVGDNIRKVRKMSGDKEEYTETAMGVIEWFPGDALPEECSGVRYKYDTYSGIIQMITRSCPIELE